MLVYSVHGYKLGMEIQSGALVRIPPTYIPQGTVRVIRYKPWSYNKAKRVKRYFKTWLNPYTEQGYLRPEYWALRRVF
jgi:hypothetical protein